MCRLIYIDAGWFVRANKALLHLRLLPPRALAHSSLPVIGGRWWSGPVFPSCFTCRRGEKREAATSGRNTADFVARYIFLPQEEVEGALSTKEIWEARGV